MVTDLGATDIASLAKAESAMTRNLKGSAFCANRDAAWRVLASTILSHQSSLFFAVGAYRV